MYYEVKELSIADLVGLTIQSAEINEEHDLVRLETDKGVLFLNWYGDCCANCFLANVQGAENLIGATVLEAENMEWEDISNKNEEYSDVLESMGTKIKTTKGHVTFETRVSHNGYYGGTLSVTELPIDQYNCVREEFTLLCPLKDF